MTHDKVSVTGTENTYASPPRSPGVHPGSIAVDLQSLVSVLQKLKPGSAGGQDGVEQNLLRHSAWRRNSS